VVYSNRLAVAIKVGGRILRENHGKVALPFGAEYSVFLKNLNSVRVMAKIQIDGQDATDGTWLVLPPNSNSEIERFIKNGNLSAGNRFKFIERTGAVEAHRGIGAEDGLVRIEFKTEKIIQPPRITRSIITGSSAGGRRADDHRESVGWVSYTSSGPISSMTGSGASLEDSVVVSAGGGGAAAAAPGSAWAPSEVPEPAGITVQGSVSSQQFHWTDSFPCHEPSEVIVLQLVGAVDGAPITRPITVDLKPTCVTCGLANPPNSSFCARCGTALTII
jgi:hypothetical protein